MVEEIQGFEGSQPTEELSRVDKDFLMYARYDINSDLNGMRFGEKAEFVDLGAIVNETLKEVKDKVSATRKFSDTTIKGELINKVNRAYNELMDSLGNLNVDYNLLSSLEISGCLDKLSQFCTITAKTNVVNINTKLTVQFYDNDILRQQMTVEDSSIASLMFSVSAPNSFSTTSLNSIRIAYEDDTRKELYFIQGDYARKAATEKNSNVCAKALIIDKITNSYCKVDISDSAQSVIDVLTTVK